MDQTRPCSGVVCVPAGWGTHSQYSGYDILADRLHALGATLVAGRTHGFLARAMAKAWLEATGMSRRKLSSVYGASVYLDERRLRPYADAASIVHFISAENSFSFLRHPRIVSTFHGSPGILDRHIVSRDPMKRIRTAIALAPNQVPWIKQTIDDVVLIPTGVDPDAFSPGAPSDKHPQAVRLAVVGQFMRDFDALERVAAATRERKDLEFRILGPLEKTRRFESYPHCRVFSRLPYPDYLAFLRQADALYLPLLDGMANTALVEALACGLPVITNKVEGQEYYVGDAGWLFERDEEVVSWLRDPAFKTQCAARGEKARARALERFAWDKVVAQVLGIYRRLLA